MEGPVSSKCWTGWTEEVEVNFKINDCKKVLKPDPIFERLLVAYSVEKLPFFELRAFQRKRCSIKTMG